MKTKEEFSKFVNRQNSLKPISMFVQCLQYKENINLFEFNDDISEYNTIANIMHTILYGYAGLLKYKLEDLIDYLIYSKEMINDSNDKDQIGIIINCLSKADTIYVLPKEYVNQYSKLKLKYGK